MTEDEKVEAMLCWVTTGHLESHGGYPFDWHWCGDTLVVAGLDAAKDCATEIVLYTRSQLLAWFDRAAEHMRHPDDWAYDEGDDTDDGVAPTDLTAFLRAMNDRDDGFGGWPAFSGDWAVLFEAFNGTFEPLPAMQGVIA